MSVTNRIVQYHHSKYPLSLYDTPGFEKIKDIANVITVINDLNTEYKNKVKQLHFIFYLMEANRNLLELDKSFLNQFQQWRIKTNNTTIPLVFILTKSKSKGEGENSKTVLAPILQNQFPFLNDSEIFSIEMPDIFQIYPPFGIKELMDWVYIFLQNHKRNENQIEAYTSTNTEQEIYDLNKQIYFLSQMTNKDIIFKSCQGAAIGIITSFVLITGAEAFIPIPFLTMALLFPAQAAMVAFVCLVYCIQSREIEISKWIKSFAIKGAVVYCGKLVANGIKCLPGTANLAGIFLDVGVSVISTSILGNLTIDHCESLFDLNKLKNWCKTAIKNYNAAIESFKELKQKFESIEANNESNNCYYEDC